MYFAYIYIVKQCINLKLYILKKEFLEKWKSQVKKGTLSFIVLNAISKKELYGYELIEIIKKSTAIIIADGTLYPLMNRLKKEGLTSSKWVEQESGIPRKYYVLTKEGKETLKQMRNHWSELEQSITKITNNEI
jgi:PadR family transcriptional regulator PadR